MRVMTIRKIPDEVHRALQRRAARHGRSAEAELLEILASAVKPETRPLVGDALAAWGREIGLTDEELEVFDRGRDKTPAQPLKFD